MENQHPRTYTNENYSVDFSTVSVPDIISQNTFTPIVVETIEEDGNKEDRNIFQNFEISPKKDTQDYMCYVCGEKAGKHSYYGGQVNEKDPFKNSIFWVLGLCIMSSFLQKISSVKIL